VKTRHSFANLQAIRAIAAVQVMVFHTPFWRPHFLSQTPWGVDLFFVLPGFIISYSAGTSLSLFIVKRISRLVPMYWLMTFITFIASALLPSFFKNTRPILSHLFLSLGFIPFHKSEKIMAPVLHVGWTINYEFFFYVIFGFAMYLSLRNPRWIALITIVFLVILGIKFGSISDILNFYCNPLIIEFALGILIYEIWRRQNDGRLPNIPMIAWTLIGSGALCIIVFAPLSRDPWIQLVDHGLPSFLIVLSGVELDQYVRCPRFIRTIGDASYSLYLIHYHILMLPLTLIAPEKKLTPLTFVVSLIVWILIVQISILIYRYIEKPIIEFTRKFLMYYVLRENISDRSYV